MRILISISTILLLTSCATIMNSKFTEVNLYTNHDGLKVYIDDSANYSYAPTKILVERSNQPLFITIEGEDYKDKIQIPSIVSLEFWLGNIFNGATFVGHLIDLSNNKRFHYPLKIHYDLDYPNRVNYRYKTPEKPTNLLKQPAQKVVYTGEKGALNLKFSFPEGNHFVINKENEVGNSFGFLGITSEIDYYYKSNRYMGIGIGTLTDFMLPFPAPVDFLGEHERSFGAYLDVVNGIDVNRFSFSYGLSLSTYSFYLYNTEEVFPLYISYVQYSNREKKVGLSFSTKYKITNYFDAGIKYLPSLYTFDINEFSYGHFLFLDFAFNYKIIKAKKNRSSF